MSVCMNVFIRLWKPVKGVNMKKHTGITKEIHISIGHYEQQDGFVSHQLQ